MNIPSFAFVGQPNVGKTTVLATFSENDKARISPMPGSTTKCREYAVNLNERVFIRLWDTPGFQNPADVLDWFQKNKGKGNLPRLFLEEFEGKRYLDECEIMRPLAEGAAAVYVIDESVPVDLRDKHQFEILRLCSVPRVAVFNPKDNDNDYADAWRELVRQEFNGGCHQFNAHRASFTDRIGLLEMLGSIKQEWKKSIDEAIEALKDDWDKRLDDTARLFVRGLKDLIQARGSHTIDSRLNRETAKLEAEKHLKNKIRRVEEVCRAEVRSIYRHKGQQWQIDDRELDLDIFSDEVWKLFGLSKMQLFIYAIGGGASVGFIADSILPFITLGGGTLVGAASGGAAAFWGGKHAVHVKLIPIPVVGRMLGRKLGGEQAEARIQASSNAPFVFTDRLLRYFWFASRWCHGYRGDANAALKPSESAEQIAQTKNWSLKESKILINYLRDVAKPSPKDQLESDLRRLLVGKLKAITESV